LANETLWETLRALAPNAGIYLAAFGLLLNAYAILKNIRSRKLLNYQEIVKSHRDLWKLTLDSPEKYSRVLSLDPDLATTPITEEERRFVNLLLIHMTSAFYFAKYSDMVRIEKMREDVWRVMSLPIPREIWHDARHNFNRDFVRLIEQSRGLARWTQRLLHAQPLLPPTTRRWTILLLVALPEKLTGIVGRFGDRVLTVYDPAFRLTPAFVRENALDLVICCGYGRFLDKSVLRRVVAINIHTSYLPLNRGPNPNLWSILDGTKRGVSIHYIDENADTGDIIDQQETPMPDDRVDTLRSAFDRSVDEGMAFFASTWPKIRAGQSKRFPQPSGGTTHTKADQVVLKSLFTEDGLSLPLHEFRDRALSLLGRTR
jgi:formyl transferase-like protein